MISYPNRGMICLPVLMKLAGGVILFLGIVGLLSGKVFPAESLLSNQIWLCLLVPAAGILEYLFRGKGQRSLCGLSPNQIWRTTQRETVFALVAVLSVAAISEEAAISTACLAVFFCLYAGWIAWMNHRGSRLLSRFVHRLPLDFEYRRVTENAVRAIFPSKIAR